MKVQIPGAGGVPRVDQVGEEGAVCLIAGWLEAINVSMVVVISTMSFNSPFNSHRIHPYR